MIDPICNLIVLRLGEIFLKGNNRRHFEDLLLAHVHRSLKPFPRCHVKSGQGRVFIECPSDDIARAMDSLRFVFGVTSMSPAVSTKADLDDIIETVVALLTHRVPRPTSFKVYAKRSDKRFPLKSPEVARTVGLEAFRRTQFSVDMEHPECHVGVEIGEKKTFVYLDRREGPGGLPIGTAGNVLLLLSGGIDSPVAGHLMQKRGCTLHAIYFHSPPHTGEHTKDKVSQLARLLAQRQAEFTFYVVPFTAAQEALREHADPRLLVVLYRRMMVRIASAIAQKQGCLALATGDNLAQVASQTIENMACIEDASALPIFRPLLTYDKLETVCIAETIGSYAISIVPHIDCCSLFVPKHPSTRVRPEQAHRAESRLNVADIVERCVNSVEIHTV